AAGGGGGVAASRRRLSGLRRVCDGRGGRCQRLGRPRSGDPRVVARLPAGRRIDRADLLRERGRRLVRGRPARSSARVPLSTVRTSSRGQSPAPYRARFPAPSRPPSDDPPILRRPPMTHSASSDLFTRAQQVTPSGVNSPVRAFGSVGGTPPFITSASGAMLHDADGREFVDLVGSWGPMILGHANEQVV